MNDLPQPRRNRALLYVIGALVLLLIIMWIWNGVAIGRVERRIEQERAELAAQREALEEQLREESARRVEEALRLMGIPLGWAVRTEAIRDDFDQIEEYATSLIKQPRVRRVIFVNAEGNVQLSTDRKLQGATAASLFGSLTRRNEIALQKTDSSDYELMVPILGYNSRLGSLIVTIDAE